MTVLGELATGAAMALPLASAVWDGLRFPGARPVVAGEPARRGRAAEWLRLRRVGGLWFLRLGRLQVSWCVVRRAGA